jgi:DNA-nicking Smr family endonuclease
VARVVKPPVTASAKQNAPGAASVHVKAPKAKDGGAELWGRVKASVKPLKRKVPQVAPPQITSPAIAAFSKPRSAAQITEGAEAKRVRGRVPAPLLPSPAKPVVATKRAEIGSAPVDKGWERQLKGGRIVPDMTIDLHGHFLAGAHTALSRALDRAAVQGARVLLVIAGKQRGPDEAPRGAIRRELTTWLAHSHHAQRILAVRGAHPRHGGAGAVYILLRKG